MKNLSLLQALENNNVVRHRDLHIFLESRLTYGGEVISLKHRRLSPSFSLGKFLILISLRGWVDLRELMKLEELDLPKNKMTLSGIEPATFRVAA
jgi:hypothetical protein